MQHVSCAVSDVDDLVIAKVVTECFVFSRPSSFHIMCCIIVSASRIMNPSKCFSTSVCPLCCISLHLILLVSLISLSKIIASVSS